MMIRHWNPDTLPAPASRYSQLALATDCRRRLEIAGQVGVLADGALAKGLSAQMDAALANVDAALLAAGMTRADLMKITVYLIDSDPRSIATYRARRDAWVADGVAPAATLLIVAGLASPDWLVEIDAVAAA